MYLFVFILKDDFTEYKILFYLAVLHGMWNLSSLTKKLTCAPRVKAQCPNQWTTREVLRLSDSWLTYIFGFSTLNMSFHFLLAFIISEENLLLTFLVFPCEWEVVFLLLFSSYLLLICLVYVWYLLVLSCMEYVELLGNVDCCSPIWGVFSHYFFDYIFSSFLYFCEKSFLLSSHVAVFYAFPFSRRLLICFHYFFSVFFRLYSLYPSISKFPIFILIYIIFTSESPGWIFLLGHRTSQLLNFHYLK